MKLAFIITVYLGACFAAALATGEIQKICGMQFASVGTDTEVYHAEDASK